MRGSLCLLGLLFPVLAIAQTEALTVPTGQPVSRIEILFEDHPEVSENWLVLRFLAPDIARGLGKFSYEDAAPDMDYLCTEVGLDAALAFGDAVDVIVVAMLDQPQPRGIANPDVTQFMSAYRRTAEGCIWE